MFTSGATDGRTRVKGARSTDLVGAATGPPGCRELPLRKLRRMDNFPPARIIQHTAGFLVKAPCEFLGRANPLPHEPRTDDVAVLDFDGMTAYSYAAVLANLPDFLEQA